MSIINILNPKMRLKKIEMKEKMNQKKKVIRLHLS